MKTKCDSTSLVKKNPRQEQLNGMLSEIEVAF